LTLSSFLMMIATDLMTIASFLNAFTTMKR